MWERARIGFEGSTDIGEHAAQPRFPGHRKFMRRPLQQWLTPACGWLLLVAGCLWPYQANPAHWHFHSLWYFWAGTGLCQQARCHGTEERRTRGRWGQEGAGAFSRPGGGPRTVPRLLHPSWTPGQLAKLPCWVRIQKRLPVSSHLHFYPGSSAQGFQWKKAQSVSITQPGPLLSLCRERPPWWPLRLHKDSSIWVWDDAPEKCFS